MRTRRKIGWRRRKSRLCRVVSLLPTVQCCSAGAFVSINLCRWIIQIVSLAVHYHARMECTCVVAGTKSTLALARRWAKTWEEKKRQRRHTTRRPHRQRLCILRRCTVYQHCLCHRMSVVPPQCLQDEAVTASKSKAVLYLSKPVENTQTHTLKSSLRSKLLNCWIEQTAKNKKGTMTLSLCIFPLSLIPKWKWLQKEILWTLTTILILFIFWTPMQSGSNPDWLHILNNKECLWSTEIVVCLRQKTSWVDGLLLKTVEDDVEFVTNVIAHSAYSSSVDTAKITYRRATDHRFKLHFSLSHSRFGKYLLASYSLLSTAEQNICHESTALIIARKYTLLFSKTVFPQKLSQTSATKCKEQLTILVVAPVNSARSLHKPRTVCGYFAAT